MLRGVSNLNLDGKSRIAIPSRYRGEVLATCDGKLVITVDRDRCLLIYPLPEWEMIERALMARPNMDKQVRRMQRLLLGHATDCDMSAQGRVLIPAPLREFARLGKQVMLVGQGNKFELWNSDYWAGQCEAWLQEEEENEGFSDAIGSLSI